MFQACRLQQGKLLSCSVGLRESFLSGVLADLGEEDTEDFSNTATEKIRLIFSLCCL